MILWYRPSQSEPNTFECEHAHMHTHWTRITKINWWKKKNEQKERRQINMSSVLFVWFYRVEKQKSLPWLHFSHLRNSKQDNFSPFADKRKEKKLVYRKRWNLKEESKKNDFSASMNCVFNKSLDFWHRNQTTEIQSKSKWNFPLALINLQWMHEICAYEHCPFR